MTALRFFRTAAFLAGLFLAAGCAVGPDYRRPDAPLAGPYRTDPPPATASAPPLQTWWLGFGDPMLNRVVEQVRANNLDIAQARARVLASRAEARAAGAALLPAGAAAGQAQAVRQSLDSPIGAIGRHLPGFNRDGALYELGADASWDIDLFGGLKRGRDAARADARAQAAGADGVRLAVIADAVDAYLQVRAYQARLDVAARQEKVQTDLVDLLRRRAAEGVAPERDLRLTQAALEGVRASIPPLNAGLSVELNRLDVLTGAQPGTWRAELARSAPLPAPPALKPGAGPADLLRRRPDIIAAEQRMIAANARIGQALAEYYPKVSLSGLLGVQSLDSNRLFLGEAVQAAGGGALRWRLFDFARVDAEVAQARAEDAEALAAWRATALRATEEVEDAFADLVQQEARAAALDRQIAQLSIARGQSEDAYESGAVNLLEVREADRDLLNAADQLAQARVGAARAAVASYRALGGGWTVEEGK